MLNSRSFIFDPRLVGGTGSLVVPNVEALYKLGQSRSLFADCCLFACLAKFHTDLCHFFGMVTAGKENSSRTLASDLEIL